jgi:disulfide bond formation protein DsbB
MLVTTLKGALSVLAYAAQAIVLVLFINLFLKGKWSKKIKEYVGRNMLLFSAIVATIAILGSMFFSNIAMYNPCLLCWYQRIAIFPISLMLWIAYVKKDTKVVKYVMALALIGLVLSGYHWGMQLFPPENPAPCGFDSHCVGRYIYDYGIMTIAGMAFSTCLLIIMILVNYLNIPKRERRKIRR